MRRDFVTLGKRWLKLVPWTLEWLLEMHALDHFNRQQRLCCHAPVALAVEVLAIKREEQRGHKDLHLACCKPEGTPEQADAFRHTPKRSAGQQSHRTGGAWPSGEAEELLRLRSIVEWQVGSPTVFPAFGAEALRVQVGGKWLTKCLEAWAAAGGKASENAADFLPWKMSEAVKAVMCVLLYGEPEVHDTTRPFPGPLAHASLCPVPTS